MVRVYNRTSEKATRSKLRRETPKAEEVLWSKLRRRQVVGYKFRRQYSVRTYVLDFYCPTARLAIEVDGDSHFQPGVRGRDKVRQAVIESFGMHFLRVPNVEVHENLDAVLGAIQRRLMELGRQPP